MKKTIKIFLIAIFSIFLIVSAFLLFFHITLIDVKFDKNRLINLNHTVTYYDSNGESVSVESNGVSVSDNEEIPEHTKQAFISIEDKRFYKHNGIDFKGLLRATFNNIKSFSLKEGASTISQQLIKNTHLSNEKTLKRKFSEIKLTRELEKQYDKNKILETYLNTIYFGDGCYGITTAAKHYFNKSPSELNINESAVLAGIIKAPSNYSPVNNYEKCFERKNLVLKEMLTQGYITQNEYNKNSLENIVLNMENESSNYDFISLTRLEFNKFIEKSPYKNFHLNVYTSLDQNLQEILKNQLFEDEIACDKSAVIISPNGNVKAYLSTCGNLYRQMGSTLKPLVVYAPAIESDSVTEITKILDEKTNFNGYSPSNYNDKYYGYVSVKESLAKSLNTCAVKIMNYSGIPYSTSFIKKTEIKLNESDENLSLALGATENGATLIQLSAAYNVFNNNGNYTKISFIDKITADNGEIIYKSNKLENKIFSDSTISIMNDMLKYTVSDGTAKKLSYSSIPLYAKTGTVGNKNGNIDAYTISYSKDFTLGVWYGNKDNSLMPNSITGGGAPCKVSSKIWEGIYKDKTTSEIPLSDSVEFVEIDKESYNEDNFLILADKLSPERCKLEVLLKNSTIPSSISKRFSNPTIEKPKLLVENNGIKIELCLTEYIDAMIYKINKGQKIKIYDTENGFNESFIDTNIKPNEFYQYLVIPYFNYNGQKILGEEIYSEKIKSPNQKLGDWWINDLD